MLNKYSREDEANLPEFKSHDEAREYFKKKHGSDFMMIGSDEIDGEKIYYYALILNREEYNKGMERLERTGYADGLSLLNSYQKIEIWENGNIHMIH